MQVNCVLCWCSELCLCTVNCTHMTCHAFWQDGVPEALQTLLEAGMKVWVITGDKQETAINIAISCKLIRNQERLLILNAQDYLGVWCCLYTCHP